MDVSRQKVDEKAMHGPPGIEPVWVQCEGFRCLAVRDHHGQWRTLSDNTPLSGEVKPINDQMTWTAADEYHWSSFCPND